MLRTLVSVGCLVAVLALGCGGGNAEKGINKGLDKPVPEKAKAPDVKPAEPKEPAKTTDTKESKKL
ncbi:MAG: hypothetical protein K2X38_20970 [Gemmataceae bacterium]|nr:hypothetical protein [Gemmataceae bacterium]